MAGHSVCIHTEHHIIRNHSQRSTQITNDRHRSNYSRQFDPHAARPPESLYHDPLAPSARVNASDEIEWRAVAVARSASQALQTELTCCGGMATSPRRVAKVSSVTQVSSVKCQVSSVTQVSSVKWYKYRFKLL